MNDSLLSNTSKIVMEEEIELMHVNYKLKLTK